MDKIKAWVEKHPALVTVVVGIATLGLTLYIYNANKNNSSSGTTASATIPDQNLSAPLPPTQNGGSDTSTLISSMNSLLQAILQLLSKNNSSNDGASNGSGSGTGGSADNHNNQGPGITFGGTAGNNGHGIGAIIHGLFNHHRMPPILPEIYPGIHPVPPERLANEILSGPHYSNPGTSYIPANILGVISSEPIMGFEPSTHAITSQNSLVMVPSHKIPD